MASLAAALNELGILSCDMKNAYLSAPCREKTRQRSGSEFDSEAGKIVILMMALCGLKSNSTAIRTMLANITCDLGYHPSKADLDACFKAATKTKWIQASCYVVGMFR